MATGVDRKLCVSMSSLASHAPHPGDLEQIELFAEQLELIMELLQVDTMGRARMALVATDNVAEVLLYRHLQFTFTASEGLGGTLAARRFSQRERDRLRNDFDRRVRLAAANRPMFGYPTPILDEADAATFRIAHKYRNGAYHADRHNERLIVPLCHLYIAAVGRAWCRAQPDSSMGGDPDRLADLERLGRHSSGPDLGHFELPGAVIALADELLVDLDQVEAADLAERLALDIRWRAYETDKTWAELERCGLAKSEHGEMLYAAEVRYVHRADPDLVRLEDEASDALARLVERQGPDTGLEAQLRAAEEGQRRRVAELRAAFRPRLHAETGRRLEQRAMRLEHARDIPRILDRYEHLDGDMRLFESCLAWIDRERDRYTSLEEDVYRGK